MAQIGEVFNNILTMPVPKPISTGFEALDRLNVRFEPGRLYVLGGRPGMGKTSLMLDMALYAAKVENTPVHIFTLSESAETLSSRIVTRYGDLPYYKLANNESAFRQAAEKCKKDLERIPLYIYDKAFTFRDIRETILTNKLTGLVFIDNSQILVAGTETCLTKNSARRRNTDRKRQSDLSYLLWTTATFANVPIVILTQLTRRVEVQKDHRPKLGDSRDCPGLELAASVVMYIYRDRYYYPIDEYYEQEPAEIIVARNNFCGSEGTAHIIFDCSKYTFM